MVENDQSRSTGFARGPGQRRLPAALALILMGCTGGSSDRTENAAQSLPADSIHVVGTSEDIAAIRDVMPDPNGVIWVLNTTDPYFVGFAEDGSIVHAWGIQGPGPNEFQNPDALVRHAETGDVWVFDRTTNRGMVRISEPDSARLEITVRTDSVPTSRIVFPHFAGGQYSRTWVRHRDGAFLLARARPETEQVLRQWNADVIAIYEADDTPGMAFSIADVLGDPANRFPDAVLLLPYPFWDHCAGDDAFAVYDPLENAVRRFTRTGEERERSALPPERSVEVNFERVFGMVVRQEMFESSSGQAPDTAAMRSELESQWAAEIGAQFAEVFPEYIDLRCTEDGTIWLRLFDHLGRQLGLGHEWLRVRPDGTTDTIRLPDTFDFLRFADGRIWGTVRDAFDVQSVAWIRIPR